jgi:hypothetical protein
MRLIRRGATGDQPGGESSSAAPSAESPTRVAVDERGVIYVDPSCPHCGHVFDPPPKRGRKCPACGKVVVYDRGFDDLVRLVREDAGASEEEWARLKEAEDALFQRRDGRPLRRLNEERLKTYAALGIRVRVVNADTNTVVFGGDDRIGPGASSCAPCRALVGEYEARSAPLLPLADCQSRPNGICTCRYQPIWNAPTTPA